MKTIINILLILSLFLVVKGVDTSLDNKDIMLCNSAKVSKNDEYLKKCNCFYSGGNISCIYN